MATRRKFVVQAAALAAAPFISTRVTRALAIAAGSSRTTWNAYGLHTRRNLVP